ncbi:MAG: T9SS type A sorting domain-containing protein [Bacteroidota bacterium]
MKIFFTLLFYSLFPFLFSQPSIEWQHTYGGTLDDISPVVIQTSDNGMLVAGSTQSDNVDVSGNHGYYDIWVIKTDVSGNIEWQESYGGSQGEFINYAMQCSDGNYFLIGSSQSSDGDLTLNKGYADVWIFKIDTSGNIIWQKTYGGSSNEEGCYMKETADGKLWIIGKTESSDGDITTNQGLTDIWLLNLDSGGLLIQQKTYGGTHDDYGVSMAETDSSGFIIAGYSYSDDGDITTHYGLTEKCDYVALKINSSADLIWAKNYGGNENDNLMGMLSTYDGLLLYGISDSDNGNITDSHGLLDGWLIKINSNGLVLWQKSVGGSNNDYISNIVQCTDGYLYAAGTTYSSDGDIILNKGEADCWLLKLDPSGPLQWTTTFGGVFTDYANSLILFNDENAVMAASTYSSDGDITNNNGLFDYWIIKTENLAAISDTLVVETNFIVCPNPASDFLNIISFNTNSNSTIKIIDMNGRIIFHKEFDNLFTETIDISSLPNGIYVLNITSNYQNYYQKIIKN